MLEEIFRPKLVAILKWIVSKIPLSPNTLTMIGLAINGLAAYCFAYAHFRWGALVILFAGLFDMLDGAAARALPPEKRSKYGALLDSVVDRYSEILIFLGILIYYIRFYTSPLLPVILVFLSLSGSMMVSYVKARAEGLKQDCPVGFLRRPERIILLVVGGFIGKEYFIWILVIMSVLTYITSLHRLIYVAKEMDKKIENISNKGKTNE